MTSLLAWLLLLLHAPTANDDAGLGQHLEQTIPPMLERTGVPGVVVSVVRGDRVVVVRGFGLAQLDPPRPMDGETTVVRVASLSKTVTATAVAQLQHAGRLDVDVAVDDYLGDISIPSRFAAPPTLRHLLSHTSGFINNNVGRVSATPPSSGFAQFVVATMPPQLYPPGRVVSYSNHGNALAGLVVERVGGMPYADYVAAHVLAPLRMTSSSFELTPRVAEALAQGYRVDAGSVEPEPYLQFRTVPASGLHTTARDMAHFMIMHLSHGRFEGRAVLEPGAAATMRDPVSTIHPALPTYHYAFAHVDVAGHAVRSHGGSVPGFLSRVALFDEHGLGIFVAQNAGGTSLTLDIVQDIAAQLLPAATLPAVVAAGDGRPLSDDVVGRYRRVGKADTPAFTRALAVLLQSSLVVGIDDEGWLTVDGDRFVRTGDDVFARERAERVPEVVAVVRDQHGAVRAVHRGLSSAVRVPWYDGRGFQVSLFAMALLALGYGAWPRSGGEGAGASRLAARLVLVTVLVPLGYVMVADMGYPMYLRPLPLGDPSWLRLVRASSWGALTFVVIVAGRSRGAPASARRSAVVVAAGAIGLALLQLHWATPVPGLEGS